MNKCLFVKDIPFGRPFEKRQKFFEKGGNHPCLS
jgi:hypothetical protein